MGKIDLHIHSTASDGRFSPEEIVRKAARLGLNVIALTDHDSINGIAPAMEAARAFPQLKVIPGIEVSAESAGGEVHVLGYFIDYTNRELKTALDRFRNSRLVRTQGMLAKLADMGIYIEWQRVQEIAGDGSVGRPHIAQAMLEKGYITSLKEAFDKYLAYGGPAYFEREKMSPAEAVRLILRADGVPVLAHPFTVDEPEALIIELKSAGLVGVETYYKDFTAEQISILAGIAERHGLITTGGTDYHGLDESSEVMIGGVEVPMEAVERLVSMAKPQSLSLAHFDVK